MHEDVCVQHANLKIKGQLRTASEVALRCLHEMPHTLNQETSTSFKKNYLYMCGGMGRSVCHGVCVVVWWSEDNLWKLSSAMLSPRNLGPQHQQQLPVCSELSHCPETFAWSSTVILLSLLVI